MSKYNVLFITVDSWNRNFVGCYNEKAREEGLTPNLDEFSEKCITFSLSFSSSVKTSASFPSILSGCYPCKFGDWFASISENRTIISEILKSNGYFTYGFTSNPCTSSLRRYNKGYNLFKESTVIKNITGRKLEVMLALKTLFRNPYSAADKINSQIFYHLNKKRSPFFAWIHYMDVHGPYISRNGWQFKNRISAGKLWDKALGSREKITISERNKMVDVYKEKMKFLDYHMGELIRKTDDNKTIIIITGDHGDVFGSHGYYGHPAIFYNEMINVPLFIKLPSEMNITNRLCEHPVSLMDLVPTIVDLLELNVENQFDGLSLLPLIEGRKEEYKGKYIISEFSRVYACVMNGKWKLIANFAKSSFELYNLEEDYGEKNNLVKKRLDMAQKLKGVLRDHIEAHKPAN